MDRRLGVLLLVALLLVPGPAFAGTREDPEIDDANGDAFDDAGNAIPWADIREAWFVPGSSSLTVNVNVTNLSEDRRTESQDNGGRWAVNFTRQNTTYEIRAIWQNGDLTGEVVKDGATQGDAQTTAEIVRNTTVRIRWSDPFDLEGTLTETYAYTDTASTLELNQNDCHGATRADCAPGSDSFGDDVELGGTGGDASLALSIAPDNATLAPGSSGAFQVTIQNNGTADANVSLAADARPALQLSFDTENLTVQGNGSADAVLTVTAGSEANGTYTVDVTATPAEGAELTGSVDVIVDPSRGGTHDVTLTMTPASQQAIAGTTVTYTATIDNVGTTDDAYDLRVVSGPPDWVSLGSTTISVPTGGSSEVDVELKVPDSARSERVRHEVEATSQGDPTVSSTSFVVTEVSSSSGFVDALDERFRSLGLGGLLPGLGGIVVVLAILVLVVLWLRRRGPLKVEGRWVEDDETPENGE